MQNYKIKVTPETSAEAQELFFELGYKWLTQEDDSQESKYTDTRQYIFAYQEKMRLTAPSVSLGRFEEHEDQEITLPQLRDLVVLKRNDVSDATHKDEINGKYYVGCYVYIWTGSHWTKALLDKSAVSTTLKPITNDVEMTWQDALDAVKDGKEVEVKNISWFDINDLKLGQIKRGKEFRIKTQIIRIEGGDYTKEELLKIAGEME